MAERRKPIQLEEPENPTRGTGAEIDDRREAVLKLRLRGHTFEEIADRLNVSHATVRRDYDAIRSKATANAEEFDKAAFIQDALLGYDDLLKATWDQFDKATDGSKFKLDTLKELRGITDSKVKALKDLGIIEEKKPVQQVDHSVNVEILSVWDDNFKSALAESIITQQMQKQLEAPITLEELENLKEELDEDT